MKLRCIFGHKWEYYNNERIITFNLTPIPFGSKNVDLKIVDELRICERCSKKQKAFKDLLGMEILSWIEEKLTKDEIREKKIRSLGI